MKIQNTNDKVMGSIIMDNEKIEDFKRNNLLDISHIHLNTKEDNNIFGEEETPNQNIGLNYFSNICHSTTENIRSIYYSYMKKLPQKFPEVTYQEFSVIKPGWLYNQKRNLRVTDEFLFRLIPESSLIRSMRPIKEIEKIIIRSKILFEIHWSEKDLKKDIDIYEIGNMDSFFKAISKYNHILIVDEKK
eukprot:TRINITY_DN5136_c1_g1_i1.p1 TRINITY_DN5136_c1_g1~~TRINITY_DN5136_c1_g1_i1.p1  ORF type:complete len:189 (+),score=47.14 TRINITY_DN5136_c1_g1_i1:60-626(+)